MSNPPLVYLNGEFLAPEQARIPVMDRGFLFGDGVYEVIPCYQGRLFRLGHHLQRLDNSLQAIRMTNPMTHEQWSQVLEKLVAQRPEGDQALSQASRSLCALAPFIHDAQPRPQLVLASIHLPQYTRESPNGQATLVRPLHSIYYQLSMERLPNRAVRRAGPD